MRELERETELPDFTRLRCAIVGDGRIGRALARELRAAGLAVDGPLGRGSAGGDADVVILAVPDGEIAAAAASVAQRPGRLVGHCSGATTLEPLQPHEAFSLHPLMTVTHAQPAPGAAAPPVASVPADEPGVPAAASAALPASPFAGAAAAVAGSTPRAQAVATALATRLAMTPVAVADEDRAAYHAAASIASNFLVTLEAAAERVAGSAGVDRAALVPLVRAALENWAAQGPERALTGPIARGDEVTVARQRATLAERTPELLPLFDALADATRDLARGTSGPTATAAADASTPPAPAPASAGASA